MNRLKSIIIINLFSGPIRQSYKDGKPLLKLPHIAQAARESAARMNDIAGTGEESRLRVVRRGRRRRRKKEETASAKSQPTEEEATPFPFPPLIASLRKRKRIGVLSLPLPSRRAHARAQKGVGNTRRGEREVPRESREGAFLANSPSFLPSVPGRQLHFPFSLRLRARCSLSPLQRRRGARCLARSLLRSPSPTTRLPSRPCCQLHSPLAPPLDESQPGYERSQGALLFSSLI